METKGTLQAGPFNLTYRIEGDGPAVIVIGSAVYYPRTFSTALRQHLRLIFVDHRGFGSANRAYTNADFELDQLVDDVERLRQHLALDQVIILGHSGHGYIALEYAKKYPQHVSHVVLIALSPDSTEASYLAADQYLEESVCPERKARLAESLTHLDADIQADPRRRFIHRSLRSGPRIWFDSAFDAGYLWQDVEVIPEMFDYVWGKLFRELDITENIDRLQAPVFLALGRYDYWNPPYLWNRVRALFKAMCIRVFESSGHTPQLEDAALFDAELLNWLSKSPQAGQHSSV